MEQLLRHGIKLSESTPEQRKAIHELLELKKVPVLIADRPSDDFEDYSFMFDRVLGHIVWTACREEDVRVSLIDQNKFQVRIFGKTIKMKLPALPVTTGTVNVTQVK
jgi:hypothetical protein